MNVLMKLYDGCAITVSGSCMRVMLKSVCQERQRKSHYKARVQKCNKGCVHVLL